MFSFGRIIAPLALVFTVVFSQFLITLDPSSFLWPLLHPGPFFATMVILFSAFFLIAAVFNSLNAGFVVTILYAVLAIVSFLKYFYLGLPLFPWDFYTVHELIGTFFDSEYFYIVVAVVALVGIGLCIRYRTAFSKTLYVNNWKVRLAGGVISFVILSICLLSNNPVHDDFFATIKFEKVKPRASFGKNGLLLNFILMIEHGQIYPPSNYSEKTAEELLAPYRTKVLDAKLKPDIIVVMSESLFDPLKLTKVKWKVDPLKYTRSLSNGRDLSLAVVPTFGGKTANSEFELLTGNSIRFFSRGTVPYERLIDVPISSMARSLSKNGYDTVAIHPGTRDFWNRNNVYPLLGFDSFISEESFEKPAKFGKYITDDSILKMLAQSLSKPTRPQFRFIVTIQNHMPYDQSPFDLKDMAFEAQTMSKADQVVLNYYTRGVIESDRFHKKLIHFLKSRKRPTLLVIFGDHLPPLSRNFSIFKYGIVNSESIESWSPAEKLNMFTTPLVFWSNFHFHEESQPIELSLLGSRILTKLGFADAYQLFLNDVSKKVRIINPSISLEKSKDLKYWISAYKILQYRMLTQGILSDNSVAQF